MVDTLFKFPNLFEDTGIIKIAKCIEIHGSERKSAMLKRKGGKTIRKEVMVTLLYIILGF